MTKDEDYPASPAAGNASVATRDVAAERLSQRSSQIQTASTPESQIPGGVIALSVLHYSRPGQADLAGLAKEIRKGTVFVINLSRKSGWLDAAAGRLA
jgi:hypothetical protein